MPQTTNPRPTDPHAQLISIYAINDAMNQLILSHLNPQAWRATPPGRKANGRTIAAIFAHLHNTRLVWLKHSAPHLKCPAPLDPDRCTMKQAVTDALSSDANRRVTKFLRGNWAPTWPANATMFAYMFCREAHHRGQILMLARQLGYRLPDNKVAYAIWNKLWRRAAV